MEVEQAKNLHDDRIQNQLQLQAVQVQKVLGHHRIPATVVGGTISKQSISFDLRSQVNGGLRRLRELKDELKKTLHIEGLQLHSEEGQLQLQVMRPFEPAVPLLDLLAQIPALSPCTAVLGLAEDGRPMLYRFTTDPKPNVLIAGDENAGKTILLRSIAASLALTNRQASVQLVAINPIAGDRQRHETHYASWQSLNYLPHMLADVATRQTEITELLQFLVREMNYRIENSFITPRIVVLMDQAATVMERGGRVVVEEVKRLAQQGAGAGIHLVLGTRRPHSPIFTPQLMTDLQARFFGRINQQKPTFMQVGETRVETNTLLGEGDFLASSGSRITRFQGAYVDDYDLHMGLTHLYRRRRVLLAQPINNRVQLDPIAASSEQESKHFSFVEGLVSVG